MMLVRIWNQIRWIYLPLLTNSPDKSLFKSICLSAADSDSSAPSGRIWQSLLWAWPCIRLHKKWKTNYLRIISQYEQKAKWMASINWHTSNDFSETILFYTKDLTQSCNVVTYLSPWCHAVQVLNYLSFLMRAVPLK